MNILALDTCTEMCSAALLIDGQIYSKAELTQRGHSDKILAMLQTVLDEAQTTLQAVDVMAFGRGPGSFTGVRIGVGIAQGIAFARELPVAAVSSLAAVAQQAMNQHKVERVAVAMDARMGEIYCAHFVRRDGLATLADTEQVCPPEQFKPATQDDWFAAGTGWGEYAEQLTTNFAGQLSGSDNACFPQAAEIIQLATQMAAEGALQAAEQALPVYLRDNVAKKKGEQ